jgi:hypothetical protein
MNARRGSSEQREQTAVDDVRRVREQLARESQGDIRKHSAQTEKAIATTIEKLHLKRVPLVPRKDRNGTGG